MLIQTRVRIICGLLVATILLLGGSGAIVASRLLAAQERTQVLTTVMGNHLEAARMHEALRAHVLEALYRSTKPDGADQLAKRSAALRADVAHFQTVVEANQRLDLSDNVRDALRAERGPLTIYMAAALDIAELAPRDAPAAARRMADFDTKSIILDRLLTAASDRLEKEFADNVSSVERASQWWSRVLLLAAVFGLLVVGWVTRVLHGRIVAPVRRLTVALGQLTAGRLDVSVPDAAGDDEIGQLGKGLQAFRAAVVAARSAEVAQQAAERDRQAREFHAAAALDTEQQRRDDLEAMAAALDERVLSAARRMLAAATDMQAVARAMGSSATATMVDAATAATASQQSASSMQAVAAASEQLSRAIGEISARMQVSKDAARQIHDRVADAQRLGSRLTSAVDQIGLVTTLIAEVANKTNLLALNAAIEAARAGVAGEGFSVVAQEVKGLAEQTQAATGEIADQVGAVRRNAAAVAEAVASMAAVSGELEEVATSVASAVEQQNAATAAIGSSVHDSSTGLDSLECNISAVREQAQATETTARQVTASASALETEIKALSGEVSEFIARVRAA